jgi:hypothetical protein
MWIWNPTANNYGVCNSATGTGTNSVSKYIAPMQGYFVQASGAGTLGTTNAVRVHHGGKWFKDEETDSSMVSLVVHAAADKSFDEIRLLFGNPDNQSGARKLFSTVVTAPGLYMPLAGENYSVRYLTDTIDNPVVPVRFKTGRDGSYTITCDFDAGKFEIVTLEDTKTHAIQNMKNRRTYDFYATGTDDADRFVLHFGAGNNDSYQVLPARIYTDGIGLIIDLTLVTKESSVLVCDVLGRILLKKSLPGSTLYKFDINAKSQILVVQLKNQQGGICRKLYYNNNNE